MRFGHTTLLAISLGILPWLAAGAAASPRGRARMRRHRQGRPTSMETLSAAGQQKRNGPDTGGVEADLHPGLAGLLGPDGVTHMPRVRKTTASALRRAATMPVRVERRGAMFCSAGIWHRNQWRDAAVAARRPPGGGRSNPANPASRGATRAPGAPTLAKTSTYTEILGPPWAVLAAGETVPQSG
jgi:hypothetical protein